MSISKRTQNISSFLVMDVLEAAHSLEREEKSVIHLEIGEPDFDTPDCIKRAACRSLEQNQTHYTHSLGIIELREAICEHYRDRYGVEPHPDQVIVTQGTSPALFLVFAALLEEGDKVVIPDPGYACYPNFITFAGAEPLRVPVLEEDGFQYRPSRIKAALDPKVKAIMINSPSNPTGTLLSAERMQAVADLGPYVVSDEIYHGLVYEGRERSILEFTDRAFALNGFSKLYAMTGFRLGYVIAPKDFVRPIQKLCQNFFISANTTAQWAGIAALKESAADVERMRKTYDERRRFMLKGLRKLGFKIENDPTGAFYVLVDCRHLAEKFGGSSYELAFDILEKALVGVTPGIDFGPGAEGYIRFSYANSVENIAKAINRLKKYLAEEF